MDDYRPKTAGFRPKVDDIGTQMDDFRTKLDDYRPKTADYRTKVDDFRPFRDGFTHRPTLIHPSWAIHLWRRGDLSLTCQATAGILSQNLFVEL